MSARRAEMTTPGNPLKRRSALQRVRNLSYKQPGPELPGGDEVVDPGKLFVFKAPWPWFETDPSRLSGTTALGAPADVLITAPRTDGLDPHLGLVTSDEQLELEDLNPKTVVRRLLRKSGERLDRSSRYFLDGRRAVYAEAAPRGDRVLVYLLAPYKDQLVEGFGSVPAQHLTGYRHHLMSMLATWQWAP